MTNCKELDMMKAKTFDWMQRLFVRFRYPVTLPEEIASDLGVSVSNSLSFEDFVDQLTLLSNPPRHLKRFMPRELAEAVFRSAQRKDKFGRNSLFSYYFEEGWLEFNLQFDEKSLLRRVYLQHRNLSHEQGIEIKLISDGCSGRFPL